MEQLREQGELEEERCSAEVADLEEQVEEEWNKCREQLDNVRRTRASNSGMVGVSVGGACVTLIMMQASLSKLK